MLKTRKAIDVAVACAVLAVLLPRLWASSPTAAPFISPASGTYTSGRSVTISDATSGAAIYYTTDGSTPTTASRVYVGPITIPSSPVTETVRALAVANRLSSSVTSATYTITPPLPVPSFSPVQGSYATVQHVTISTTTPGGVIHYTTDGTTPTVSSPVYGGPVAVTKNERITAFVAGVSGYANSGLVAQNYSIIVLPTQTPFISPASGTYTSGRTVTISDSTPGAAIYYTTNGSLPTTNSALYTGSINIPSVQGTENIRALAVANGIHSSIASSSYTITPPLPLPSFSPVQGSYTTVQYVTISTTAPGGVIHYTTDGTTPTVSSPVYSGPVAVTNNERITAFVAGVSGYANSGLVAQNYSVTLPTALPVMSVSGGTYTAPITVALSDSTPGAKIYYTVNNSTPTTSSSLYTVPFSLSTNTSLRVMAVAPGSSPSAMVLNVYAFLAPSPAVFPVSGTYTTPRIITISDSLAGATVFYTIDGTTPTQNSTRYTGPFKTSSSTGTEIVRAIAMSAGYQPSAISQSNIALSLSAGVIGSTVVDPTPGVQIPTNFLGFSHGWGPAQQMMGISALGTNQIYQTLVRTLTTYMGGPLVLRIGGGSTDLTGSATPATVQPFVELAQHVNVNFILGVNLGSNNLSLAEEQAKTFTSSLPSSALMALEIGNEPDGYPSNGLRPSNYSYAEFLSQYQEWAQGVSASSTSAIPIAGPGLGGGVWMVYAEPDVAASTLRANVITQHKYVACYYADRPLQNDILLQPASSTASLYYLQPYAATAHQVHSIFRLDEVNSICNGGQPGVSDSFSSALWAIDTMFEDANAGVDGVNWGTDYDGGPYDLFKFSIWYNGLKNIYSLTTVRPLYYGLLFFSQAAGKNAQLLSATSLTDSNIKVWVTTDRTGGAHIVVINKEQTTAGNVQVTLPGYSVGSLVRLTAGSYLATGGLSIAGQTFDNSPDGTLQGSWTAETVYPAAGVWTIPVNPMSAVLVNLRP